MDDFVLSNLQESRNEWCSRLVSIFTPLILGGVKSLFNESWKLCIDNDEPNKYLMTFQNLLSRIPKWNNEIIEDERKRIIERSGCNYLEDLITCVHIIQLKVLTCIRVGNKQKKIDISIPKLDSFIHKVYINVARKVYSNVYLFDKNISPLQLQKNNRELESIIQECILISIRESIPTEAIIRAYMDESVEQEEEVIIEDINEEEEKEAEEIIVPTSQHDSINDIDEVVPDVVPAIQNVDNEAVVTKLSFNDMDAILDESDNVKTIEAPKSIERLEEISTERAFQRQLDEESDDERIQISAEQVDLRDFDELGSTHPGHNNDDSIILDGIEELV
ncbi:hypothetical protein OAS95_02070 [Pelagibacteraceae bacterium]|nr:hypothetical protein [Pelagibacteraceae bacterium]